MRTYADHLPRVRDPAVQMLLSHAGQYDARLVALVARDTLTPDQQVAPKCPSLKRFWAWRHVNFQSAAGSCKPL